jgi:hypothetical protein
MRVAEVQTGRTHGMGGSQGSSLAGKIDHDNDNNRLTFTLFFQSTNPKFMKEHRSIDVNATSDVQELQRLA